MPERRRERNLIREALTGVSIFTAALVLSLASGHDASAENDKSLLQDGSHVVTPTPLKSEIHLALTATAVAEKGNNFIAEPGFNNEFMTKTHNGTFLVRYSTLKENKNGEKQLMKYSGSSWVVAATDEQLCIVTNKHVVSPEDSDPINSVLLARLQKDRSFVRYKVLAQADSDNYDASLLVLERPKGRTIKDEVVLKYKDDQVLDGKAMAVGYPSIFYGDDKAINGSVWAHVIDIREEEGYFIAAATNGHGSSGSPVVINKNGEPIVVGMIFAGARNGDDILFVTPIDVDNLMKKANSQLASKACI